MEKLSSITERKFIESYPVKNKKILTEDGFKPILYVHKTIPYKKVIIKTKNGLKLECAYNHVIIDENYNEVYAINSLNKNIITSKGISKIVSVIDTGIEEHMYDISIDSDTELYFSDGILSHNSGKTVGTSAHIVHKLLFKKEFNVGIVANTNDLTLEIVSMIKQMIELLPAWLKPGIKSWNARSIFLDNGNKIISAVAGPSALKGRTIGLLLVDECGFIQDNKINPFFDSVMPTLSSGKNTQIILISTPNGFNKFYEIWNEAEKGLNGYKTFKVDYTRVPGRDEKWKKETIASEGQIAFLRNHAVAFLGSSKTLLDGETLDKINLMKKKHIDKLDFIHPDIKQYIKPSTKYSYVIGIDGAKTSLSSTTDSDFISMQVLQIDFENKKIKQAATLRTKSIHYTEMADIAYNLGCYYNNAYISVENNEAAGQQCANTLFEKYEYENVISSKLRPDVFGFRTTKETKRLGLSNLRKLFEKNIIEIYDVDTIDEFFTFVQKPNGTFSAENGSHDDSIMSLVASLYFLQDDEAILDFEDITLDYFINTDTISLPNKIQTEFEEQDELDFIGTTNSDSNDINWLFGY